MHLDMLAHAWDAPLFVIYALPSPFHPPRIVLFSTVHSQGGLGPFMKDVVKDVDSLGGFVKDVHPINENMEIYTSINSMYVFQKRPQTCSRLSACLS